jgi:iron complex outermembrane recepter protein
MGLRLRLLIFLVFFVQYFSLASNLYPVYILVRDAERQPLIGATIQLTRVDTDNTFFSTTDQSGRARFEGLENAMYFVNIRYMGFLPFEENIVIRPDQRQFEFQMREDAIALGEVTVTARRPLIRQEDDKMIIDPEPLVNISTNTLEILEKTPGLFVDQDGGIFLSSATPAAIYINGREQKMSSQDINTILRSLPPNSVQYIEVLRTPSTRYDAASSGGIINIVLKKGVKIGRFGSVSTGMNQGVAGNRFVGISLNNSGDRTTSYLNTNYNFNGQVEDLNSIRFLPQETTLSQSASSRSGNNTGYIGYGLNFEARPRLNLSYDGRINASKRQSDATNRNLLETIEYQQISETSNLVSNRSGFISLQQDLGLNLKLDTIGSEWDTKFGYSFNSNNNEQNYETSFFFPNNAMITGEGNNQQGRHFLQFQSDLTYQFKNRIKLETGLKGTIQDYDSNAEYFINYEGNQVADPLRTNAFNYQERISAAYAQASFPLPGQLILKTGVRLEHTFMEGRQTIPTDTNFVVNRADWFPYLYLSRRLVEIAGYELRSFMIFRRTIGRPGYQSLNPYIRYVDQYLYETGNPALKPQFTDNIEANISMNDMPIFAIGRNYTRDIFSQVVYQDEDAGSVAVRTYDNLGKSKETYFRITGAIPPGGKYFFVAGAQYNLNEYDGFYENQPLTFSRGSWRFFTFHSLTLARNTRLTMTGFMMTRGQMNFYELDTFGQLNFGLNQSFMNRKLNISISARDVLRTMVTQFTLNQGSMQMQGDRYTDNRRIGINIRYNFGIPKKSERLETMPIQFDLGE